MHASACFLLVSLGTLAPLGASADTPKPRRDGFMARGLFGFGYQRQTSTAQTVQGVSGTLALQVGWMLDPALGLFGEVTSNSANGPSFEPNGVFADGDDNVEASMTGLGAGVIWYPGPENLAFTLSLQAATADQTERDDEGETKRRYTGGWGFGTTVTLGRDWAVDPDWALGAAVVASFARLPDKGQAGPVHHDGAFGVAFTVRFD